MASSPQQQPPVDKDLLKLQANSAINLYNTKSGAHYSMVKLEALKSRVDKGDHCYLTLEFHGAKSGAEEDTTTFAAQVYQQGSQWWPILCYQLGKPQEAAFAHISLIERNFNARDYDYEHHARAAIVIYNEQHGTNYEFVKVLGHRMIWNDAFRPLYKRYTITFKSTKNDDEDHTTTFVVKFRQSATPLIPLKLLSCQPRNQ